MLADAPDDQLRAEVINTFLGNIDLDDVDLRHQVNAELAAYRHPVEDPQS